MASLSEMMVNSQLEASDPMKFVRAPDFAEARVQGAQLALKKQELEMQRQKLQKDMEAAKGAQMDKMVEAIQKGAAYKGQARTNYYNKVLPTYRDSLGLTDKFPDDTLKFITADPDQLARVNTIVAQVRKGVISEDQAIALVNDPVKFADVPPEIREDITGQLADAAKTAITAESTRQNTMATQMGQDRRQREEFRTTGERKVAQGVAEEFTKYEAIGGSSALDKTEAALKDAIQQLKENKVKTGGIAENLPYGGQVAVLARTNKPLKALMDKVLSTQNIKALSGDPNPTERQISDINSRILDPAASNSTNIEKLEAELKRVQTDRARKEAQFVQAGHMSAPRGSARAKSSAGLAGDADSTPSAQVDRAVKNVISQDSSVADKVSKATNWLKSNLANLPGDANAISAQLIKRGFTPEQVSQILAGAGVK